MVPNEWKKGVLADIATVTSGGTPSRKNDSYWNGHIPWVTTSEVKYGVITDTEQKITQEGLDNSSAKIFPENTILMAMYGQGKTRGQVAKLGLKASTNQACAALLLNKDHDVDYYYQYLISQYENIRELANSGGQQNLSAGIIKDIHIPIPPVAEQQKIAKILSTWDNAISTTEKLITNSKQHKKALMQQLLTGKKRLVNPETGEQFEGEWEELKLSDCVALMKSGLSRKLENNNVGIAVLRSNNVGERYTSSEDLKYWYLNDPQGAKVENYILDDGDILVNFINSLSQIGKTCIYKKNEGLNAIYTTNLLRLKPNLEMVTGDFLFYLTKTSHYRNAVKSITKPAVNQASFTTKEFAAIAFLRPKINEQQKIASVLTAADKEIELLEEKLAHLKQEKKALMQQLLTGKRRVKIAA